MTGRDRVIAALDVPTHDDAIRLVDTLDNVACFKIGLRLVLAGDLPGLVRRLQAARGGAAGGLFIDLKLAGDIGNTVTDFVRAAAALGTRFVTFVEAAEPAVTRHTLTTARAARGGDGCPHFLMVPLLSSLGAADLDDPARDVDAYIVDRGRAMLDAGCDGLVVSGSAIAACRRAFPQTPLISPGIRPAWSAGDDHARWTTPADAIRAGADYLVVGRPIRRAADPRAAAQRIIDEIDEAMASGAPPAARRGTGRNPARQGSASATHSPG